MSPDYDGSSEYTEPITIFVGKEGLEMTNVYPNPVLDDLNIVVGSNIEGICNIKVYNIAEQIFYSENVAILNGLNSFSLDVSALSSG